MPTTDKESVRKARMGISALQSERRIGKAVCIRAISRVHWERAALRTDSRVRHRADGLPAGCPVQPPWLGR
jgi:hypothetical protein